MDNTSFSFRPQFISIVTLIFISPFVQFASSQPRLADSVQFQSFHNDLSNKTTNLSRWVGGELGIHSSNLREKDELSSGIIVHINFFSTPINNWSNVLLSATYWHTILKNENIVYSAQNIPRIQTMESSIDFFGVEGIYAIDLYRWKDLNFQLCPQVGIEGAKSNQGIFLAYGLSSNVEFYQTERLKLNIRISAERGDKTLDFGGNGFGFSTISILTGVSVNLFK